MARLPRWISLCLLLACLTACASETNSMLQPGGDAAPAADTPVVAADAPPDQTPATIDTEAPARATAGEEIMVRCVVRNRAGEALTLDGDAPEVRVEPAMLVRRDAMRVIASRVGTASVRCALRNLVDDTPAQVEIVAGAPARVTTTLDRNAITAGERATATCAVTDGEGNALPDTATVATMPTGEGVTVDRRAVTVTRAGSYTVACQVTGATGTPAMLTVNPGLPATLHVTRDPDRMVYTRGGEIEFVTVVEDRYGNRIAMPMLSFASDPTAVAVRPGAFRYDTEGRYTVTVQVTGPTDMGRTLRETTSFVVDSSGPAITCDGDATMVDLAPGASMTVRGSLRDTSGVRGVRVGGRDVTLNADGTFQGSVTSRFGMNFVEVRATDTLGMENVRFCTFLVSNRWQAESGLLGDGVSLQLTQAGVDDNDPVTPITSLGDVLQTVLNSPGLSAQLHASLLAANPLSNGCILRPCVLGVCTCLASERIDYRDRDFRGPNTTTLTLVDGGLRAHVRFENLSLRLAVNGTIDTDVWVRFRSLDVDLIFNLSASGGMPQASVRAGSVSVSVGTISVDVVGTGFVRNILDALVDLITSIANNALRNQVSQLLRDYVQNSFNATLNDLVRGLNVSSLGATFDVPRLEGTGTVGLGFGLGISNLDATAARLRAGIGTRITTSRVTRATTSRGVALQPASTTEPTRRTPATVLLQPGVLNQALHALWRGGYFDAHITGARLGAGLPAGADAVLTAALPPVASLRSDGRINLDLGALSGTVTLPGFATAPVRVTIGARASAAVTLTGNDLHFGSLTVDEIYVGFDDVSMTATENAMLRMGLQLIVQQLVDRSLNDALPAIPIPGFRVPESLRTYGLPVGRELGITMPALSVEQSLFVLRGGFGVR